MFRCRFFQFSHLQVVTFYYLIKYSTFSPCTRLCDETVQKNLWHSISRWLKNNHISPSEYQYRSSTNVEHHDGSGLQGRHRDAFNSYAECVAAPRAEELIENVAFRLPMLAPASTFPPAFSSTKCAKIDLMMGVEGCKNFNICHSTPMMMWNILISAVIFHIFEKPNFCGFNFNG